MSTTPTLQADCRLAPATGEAPRYLVVFLHGVGANGADLMSLAVSWSSLLPQAEFISPNAPFPYSGGFVGEDSFEWFSLEDISVENREERVRAVAPILNAFLDAELARRHLSDAQLALVGFSQGTIMSLYAALRRPQPCAAVLGYSGRLSGDASLAEELQSRPRMFLLHGAEDSVIPAEELAHAAALLSANDVPHITRLIPGLGHGISVEGERLGGRFLQACLENPGVSLECLSVESA